MIYAMQGAISAGFLLVRERSACLLFILFRRMTRSAAAICWRCASVSGPLPTSATELTFRVQKAPADAFPSLISMPISMPIGYSLHDYSRADHKRALVL